MAMRRAMGRPFVPPYAVWFVFSSILLKDGFSILMLLVYGAMMAMLWLVLPATAGVSPEANRYGLLALAGCGLGIGAEIGFLAGAGRGLAIWSLLLFVLVRAMTDLTMSHLALGARARPAVVAWRRAHVLGLAVGVLGLLAVLSTHTLAAGEQAASRRFHGVALVGLGGILALLALVLVMVDVVAVVLAMRATDTTRSPSQLLDEVSSAARYRDDDETEKGDDA